LIFHVPARRLEMMQRQRIGARDVNTLLAIFTQAAIPGWRRYVPGQRSINGPDSGDDNGLSPADAPLKSPGLKRVELHKTILLVESETALRKLMAEVLTSNGYKVITAGDGEQAARMFSRYHSEIGLVLSDVHLPKLAGDRLLRIMRKVDPRIPVVFETGYLDQDLKSTLLRAGAKGFIEKPQFPDAILASVREAFCNQ
jgi:CheY-like chemotaxis protein